MTEEPTPDPAELARLLSRGGKVDRAALEALYASIDADDSESQPRVRFTLHKDLCKRLDRYLVDRIPFMSRTALQRLIDEEAVTVNDRQPKASTRLRLGDAVQVVLPPPPSNQIPPEDIPLDVIFEDDDLIVINKQPDIIVHPARAMKSGTIVNALSWRFHHQTSGSLSTVGEEFARPGIVHRLDRFTSGAMVAAKSDTAHWRLGHQFQNRTVDKRYLAVVHGEVRLNEDLIDLPLGRHPRIFDRYAVRHDEFGKPARTIYRVRERYRGYTLVELQLLTGRTHQIRIHLGEIGHPIVGDDYYGGRRISRGNLIPKGEESPGRTRDEPLMARQALHAARLEFDHPISNQRVVFHAPPWRDIEEMIGVLRTHRDPTPVESPGTLVPLAPPAS